MKRAASASGLVWVCGVCRGVKMRAAGGLPGRVGCVQGVNMRGAA